MKRRSAPVVASLLLALAALACNLPVGGPPRPGPAIPVSEEAAQRAEQKVAAALEAASQTRSFTVTLTQEEVTSWVALRAETYALQAGERVPLDNLQIYLDDNVVRLYSDYNDSGVSAGALVTVTPRVTPAGLVEAEVTAAQVGPVALSAADLEALNQAIHDNLSAAMARLEGRYQITGLSVDDGLITVSGQVLF